MSQAPAGWYPQPDGGQRYWDGTAWTEHFVPGVQQPAVTAASPGTTTVASTLAPTAVIPRDESARPETGVPVPPFAPPPTRQKRPWFKKKTVLIPTGLLAALVVGAALNTGDDSTTSSTAAPSVTASADYAAPSPTASESEPAEEPASSPYDETFGTFAVVTKSGRGDSTLKLPKGARAGVVTFSHKGSSNVSINVLDAKNQPTGDLLVNDIGSYSGVTAYGLSDLGDDPVKLKISADGSWKIKIAPISTAPKLGSSVDGKRDKVFLYEGAAADFAITHKGSGNFVVLQVGGTFPNLAVNEIGNYKGTVPFDEGPSVVTVTADGTWTLKSQ